MQHNNVEAKGKSNQRIILSNNYMIKQYKKIKDTPHNLKHELLLIRNTIQFM